jgi:SAM-dependent methyltransferase
MAEHENVYKNESERYHALVSFEDYNHNLTTGIYDLLGKGFPLVLETGAGTGRVTEILLPLSGNVVAFDLSTGMLNTAHRNNRFSKKSFPGFASADHRFLPVINRAFDWVVSGWSVCYLVSWNAETWKQEVNRALVEFSRVLTADGKILLIETLGTGLTSPNPPEKLVEYLDYLGFLGFKRQLIRTDYRFPDKQTAHQLVEFFFGKDMLSKIQQQTQPILPECTGLWTITNSEMISNLPG